MLHSLLKIGRCMQYGAEGRQFNAPAEAWAHTATTNRRGPVVLHTALLTLEHSLRDEVHQRVPEILELLRDLAQSSPARNHPPAVGQEHAETNMLPRPAWMSKTRGGSPILFCATIPHRSSWMKSSMRPR
ncbi:hypothetical protein [Accumulibacter sp.]|uniref:hypothetical protein n=1 Tax=Accumulibacter sp. TaxID=2053492 RepID=UPI0035B41883